MKISTPIIVFVLLIAVVYFYFTKQVDPANNVDPDTMPTPGNKPGGLGSLTGAGSTAAADYLSANYPNLSAQDVAKVKAMAEALNIQLYKPFPSWNDLIAQAKQLGAGAPAVKPYYNNRYGISLNTLLAAWRLKNPLQIAKINTLNNYLG